MTTRSPAPDSVPFDYERAYKFLRIQRSSDKFAAMHEMLEELRIRSLALFEPRYRYVIEEVIGLQPGSFTVLLRSGASFSGKGIHTLLTHSRYAAVFLVTVGHRIDEEMRRMSAEDFTEAYFLDGVASTMAHGVLQMLKRDVQEEAAGLACEVAYRFSPGYARWEIEEQRKIFALLRGEEIGMSLTETCFMLPQKSLSGAYGLRPMRS